MFNYLLNYARVNFPDAGFFIFMIYEYIFNCGETTIFYESDLKLPLQTIFQFRGKRYIVIYYDETETKTSIICLQFKN